MSYNFCDGKSTQRYQNIQQFNDSLSLPENTLVTSFKTYPVLNSEVINMTLTYKIFLEGLTYKKDKGTRNIF